MPKEVFAGDGEGPVDEKLLREVERLRSERSFKHFRCPILGVDEPAELCRGHVVPTGLGQTGSKNAWVVQRKDVDNFFGATIHRAIHTLDKAAEMSTIDMICDKDVSKKAGAEFLIEGEPVGHHVVNPKVPSGESGNVNIVFGQKMVQLHVTERPCPEFCVNQLWSVICWN